MKTLYIDCSMGAAGDMLAAALLELVPDRKAFIEKLNMLSIPGVKFYAEKSVKCGIAGTHMKVTINGEVEASHDSHEHSHIHVHDVNEHSHIHVHDVNEHSHIHAHDVNEHSHIHVHDDNECSRGHEHDQHDSHHHTSMQEIERLVKNMDVADHVKENILTVYKKIAEAESVVHGVPVTEIHFHEVGSFDALADITAVCLLFHELNPEQIVVSPIHVGSGQVHCAHGILPVPAPAALEILKNIPIYSGQIQGELCTPTGAALLTVFADRFGAMPAMRVEKAGYGMGEKDFEAANCVRILLGENE